MRNSYLNLKFSSKLFLKNVSNYFKCVKRLQMNTIDRNQTIIQLNKYNQLAY